MVLIVQFLDIASVLFLIQAVDVNFNLPEKVQRDAEGMWLTEGGKYLGDLRTWFNALSNPPDVDAVMVFTGYILLLYHIK